MAEIKVHAKILSNGRRHRGTIVTIASTLREIVGSIRRHKLTENCNVRNNMFSSTKGIIGMAIRRHQNGVTKIHLNHLGSSSVVL